MHGKKNHELNTDTMAWQLACILCLHLVLSRSGSCSSACSLMNTELSASDNLSELT